MEDHGLRRDDLLSDHSAFPPMRASGDLANNRPPAYVQPAGEPSTCGPECSGGVCVCDRRARLPFVGRWTLCSPQLRLMTIDRQRCGEQQRQKALTYW
jgi:hypothetical protein